MNALYIQSGGVTSVINATACGLIEASRRFSIQIPRVFAAEDGMLGVLEERLIDTACEVLEDIARLKETPGGAFGSGRYSLGTYESNRSAYQRLRDVLAAHEIRYLFLNGGNGSMAALNEISHAMTCLGYPVSCIGIPKTVDNDLYGTDTCPGFGSVAKYVAVSVREAGFDLASMSKSSTKVFILEAMGRHSGWIAAAAGLASEKAGDPPHLLLFPEVPFNPELFLARVKAVVAAYGYCVIVAAEGLLDTEGKALIESTTRDAEGHACLAGVGQLVAQLIQDRLGYKYHWALADYLQRSARHLSSAVDVAQAYELGAKAIEFAVQGKDRIMLTLERVSSQPYRWQIGTLALAHVAGIERKIPKEFIASDGFHITQTCRDYLLPLIQGESFPCFKNGLPDYVRLKNSRVQQKLPIWHV